MEFDRLKKIIVKDILGSASGEERRLLDEWRNQSEEHQRLYEKLVSGSFLEKAVSDNNKALRRREWKRLEARIVRRRGRSVRLIRFRVVAAVCILALGIGAVGLWSNSRQDRGGSPLAGSIRMGSPKAIVELAGGQQFLFNKDTTLRLEAQGIQLVSSRDTLDLIQPVRRRIQCGTDTPRRRIHHSSAGWLRRSSECRFGAESSGVFRNREPGGMVERRRIF